MAGAGYQVDGGGVILAVIPGWSEGADPESRDSGFDCFASAPE